MNTEQTEAIDQNKALVRRFVMEVLQDLRKDEIDELLAEGA